MPTCNGDEYDHLPVRRNGSFCSESAFHTCIGSSLTHHFTTSSTPQRRSPALNRRVCASSARQFFWGEDDEGIDIRISRARRPFHRANFCRRGVKRGENRVL